MRSAKPDPTSHFCAATTGAVCDGMHTINTPMEEPQDGTPYNCSAKGCLTSCASPSDCVAPNICDETNRCNSPPSSSDNASSESAGGCTAAPIVTGERGEEASRRRPLTVHEHVPLTRLRASAVCRAEGHLLVVRLRDPVTGVVAFYPPGGAVEPGEAPSETARRETREETGLDVRVTGDVTLVETYPFRWAGVDREVTTHYFAASLESDFDLTLPRVVDASYNLGAAWAPVNEALEAMRVHPVIASAVAQVLRRMNRAT